MTLFSPTLTAEEKFLFTKHLAVLVCGGIPLLEAIRSLAETAKSARMNRILSGLGDAVENGQTLSSACSRYPKTFDVFYRSLLSVGEISGTLDKSLSFLSESLEKRHALRRKIASFLLYPGFVLTAAVIVGSFVSFFVLPKLIPLFSSFETELPASTRILLSFAEIMREHGTSILLALAAVAVAVPLVVSLPIVRPLWHRFLLTLPFLGSFFQATAISVFSRDLSLMLGSGITLSNALSIEKDMLSNEVFRRYVGRLELSVTQGKTLESELLSGEYPHVPMLVGKMIGAGERTGKLDDAFRELADFFEEEADAAARNFASVLEPLLILIVGGLVAFVALSIITPLYTLTGSVHR